MKYILFPVVLLITLSVEYPLWKQYKKEGYNVTGFIKFVWDRQPHGDNMPHYTKIKTDTDAR